MVYLAFTNMALNFVRNPTKLWSIGGSLYALGNSIAIMYSTKLQIDAHFNQLYYYNFFLFLLNVNIKLIYSHKSYSLRKYLFGHKYLDI
jgi:hypothetical protein